jgi:hypothetical protein
MPRKQLRLITNSELKAQRRCAAEHHMAYELGIRPIEDPEALRVGKLIHAGLEAWWREPNPRLRLAAALATLPPDANPFELARLVEMLHGYHFRWQAEPLVAVHVEVLFRAPLVNPTTGHESRTFEQGGKLDVIVLNQDDGRHYFVEHKTTSDDITIGSVYWRLLRLDTQVSTYYAGMRTLGYEPAGVIYDVLVKPKQRPLLATPPEQRQYTKRDGKLYANQRELDETPDEYQARVREAIAEAPDKFYARGTVVRLDGEERDAQWDTWLQAQLIRDNEHAQRWPRNPDSCRRYGRLCGYFDVCTNVVSLDDLTRFVRVDDVHPELAP